LADANIPPIYWFLKLSDFKGPSALKEAISLFKESLDEYLISGQNIVLVGNYGTGKTTAICQMLKLALFKKNTVYYTTLSELVQYMTDFNLNKFYWELISKTNFLAIDEIDDRHFSKSEESQKLFGSTIEKILRHRIQNGLPTLLASNSSSLNDAFEGQHKRVLDSLLSSAKTIICMGKDNRKP
jgi:DNA replication protein DnaC